MNSSRTILNHYELTLGQTNDIMRTVAKQQSKTHLKPKRKREITKSVKQNMKKQKKKKKQ